MLPTLKPGTKVVFAGLSEPIMTIVTIDTTKNVASCEYFDDLLKDNILLDCSPASLTEIPGDGHVTRAENKSA
jgi:hypothetical protein